MITDLIETNNYAISWKLQKQPPSTFWESGTPPAKNFSPLQKDSLQTSLKWQARETKICFTLPKSHFLNNFSETPMTKNITPLEENNLYFFPPHAQTSHTHTHTHHKMFYSRALSKSYYETFYFIWQPEMMLSCLENRLLVTDNWKGRERCRREDRCTFQNLQRESKWPNATVLTVRVSGLVKKAPCGSRCL